MQVTTTSRTSKRFVVASSWVRTFITQVLHLIQTSRLRTCGKARLAGGALLATRHAGKQVSRAHSPAAAEQQWQRLR